MWAFAGLAPEAAMRCTLCNHLVEEAGDLGYKHCIRRNKARQIIPNKCTEHVPKQQAYPSGKAARPKKGEKLGYNAFLRSKMIGVLGPCLSKAKSPWKKVYDDYKHRLQTSGKGTSDGHRHSMAVRYMVKMLLLEIWKEWRAIEGLPVRPSYHEEKMGHIHSA
jgi:hypothetical protein